MGKTIREFSIEKGFHDIKDMMEQEVRCCRDIRYSTQKKVLMKKLNDLFDGEFFDDFIDCSYGNFLSRALTSYVLSHDFSISEAEAVKYITDDTHDFGIDAIYFYEDKIYIYQTKFSNSITRDDISVLKEGINNLFSYEEKENDFNNFFKLHKDEIIYYLNKDNLKIIIKIVFFGEQISNEVKSFLDNEIVNNTKFMGYIDPYQVYNRKQIMEFDISPTQIDTVLLLDNFFARTIPFEMYSGCIKVNALKELYNSYKDNLFYKNIRYFIKKSFINEQIIRTLKEEPQNFIYYNNGITIICDDIIVLPNSATSSKIKNLKLVNLNIVNGAQTVISSSSVEDISDEALIQVRIIKTLGENNFDISNNITKYNNSQNKVSLQDLRTLDDIHKKIRSEFIRFGYFYKYKTGEECVTDKDISFEDLIIALACYYHKSYIAKINKGKLWEDPIYSDILRIINYELFLKLSILKKNIDKYIDKIQKNDVEISHWDRLIIDLYFQKVYEDINNKTINEIAEIKPDDDVSEIFEQIKLFMNEHRHYRRTNRIYEEITDVIIRRVESSQKEI